MNIYNKYKPKTFKDFIEQKHLIRSIKYFIINNNIPVSYILYGNKGVGKTSFSRLYSKLLNCFQAKGINFCNKCKNCLYFNSKSYFDYLEINASLNRKVKDIKKIIKSTRYYPTFGKYKIFCIDEAHMLSKQAINSLLHILENPYKYIIFFLITTKLNKIPSPIISRCILFNFRNITIKGIYNNLKLISKNENIKYNNNSLYLIAENSLGSIRDSINILESARSISNNNINIKYINILLNKVDDNYFFNLFMYFINNRIKKIFKLINILKRKYLIKNIVDDLLYYLNKIIFLKCFKKYSIKYYIYNNINKFNTLTKKYSLTKLFYIRKKILKESIYYNNLLYDYNNLICLFIEIILDTQGRD